MSHSCFSPSPFVYPLVAQLQGEDHGTPALPLHTPTSPYPRPWTRSVFSHCTLFFRLFGVCAFPLVTYCFSCALYRSGFVGLMNASFFSPSKSGRGLCLYLLPFLDEVLKHLALLVDQCQFIYILQTFMPYAHCSWSFLFLGCVSMAHYFRCPCQWSMLSEGKYPVASLFLLGPSMASLFAPPPFLYTRSFRLYFRKCLFLKIKYCTSGEKWDLKKKSGCFRGK